MLTTQGYILLPTEAKIEAEKIKETLEIWDEFKDKIAYKTATGRGEEEQCIICADKFTIVLSLKPHVKVEHRIGVCEREHLLAISPENAKFKFKFEHPAKPNTAHVGNIYYEIIYENMEDDAVLNFAQGVLRILLMLTDLYQAETILRNIYMHHTKEDDGIFLPVSREALADAYYQNVREKCIPLSMFGSYKITSGNNTPITGYIENIEGLPRLNFAGFPDIERDMYRMLCHALYLLIDSNLKTEGELFQFNDGRIVYKKVNADSIDILFEEM